MGRKVKNEEFREIDASTLTGSWQDVGSATAASAFNAMLLGTSDADYYVSIDGGTTTYARVPGNASGAGFSLDLTANKRNEDDAPTLPIGTVFSVKHAGSAPTAGFIGIAVLYA